MINEKLIESLGETIGKHASGIPVPVVRVVDWSNFRQSPDFLRNYWWKDGSGYVRGYFDGEGTLYVKRFRLRDEEWTDPQSSQS